ncbi:MAG: aspartate/glutamate/uridylate kinase [Parcubacteria group bacterium Gr01-1014_30]|nr:MAG: aspartate/glutamate/uridylate kinase [Parcubacteria group bacterium Gr01-1014_30]
MPKTIILKLGGSIITQKKLGKPVLKTAFVKKTAKQIAGALRQKPKLKLILLNGAGSFGHPLVYKYKLKNRKIETYSLRNIAEVITTLRNLGNQIAKIFAETGLPLVPLQTSSLFERQRDKTILRNFSVLETIVKRGGTPLLGGDLVLGGSDKVYILSADEIAVILAKKIKSSQILFATDVEGVYKNFPPSRSERPMKLLDRKELNSLIKKHGAIEKMGANDVSGQMPGKLKQLAFLKNKKAFVFNGQRPYLISKVLIGQTVKGTTVLL